MYRKVVMWVYVSSLKLGVTVDSETVQAGVFWMPPVRKNPHLNDLERFIVLLLKKRRKKKNQSKHVAAIKLSLIKTRFEKLLQLP